MFIWSDIEEPSARHTSRLFRPSSQPCKTSLSRNNPQQSIYTNPPTTSQRHAKGDEHKCKYNPSLSHYIDKRAHKPDLRKRHRRSGRRSCSRNHILIDFRLLHIACAVCLVLQIANVGKWSPLCRYLRLVRAPALLCMGSSILRHSNTPVRVCARIDIVRAQWSRATVRHSGPWRHRLRTWSICRRNAADLLPGHRFGLVRVYTRRSSN